ncbi:MAG: tetratricopeptide repeat protein [Bacteroidetes bacterium]|nr:tetratricopeptide repeat protein [Bacteroidota bacterium]
MTLSFTHPLLFAFTELIKSETFVVQRMASLVTLFYLLTVTLYVKGRIVENNNFSKYAWFSGSIIMAMLAMLSKENAITLPLAIIMTEIFFLQSKKTFLILKDYRIVGLSILFIAIILFVAFRFSSGIFNPLPPDAITNFVEITPANYLFTQFSVLLKYLQMLLFPINQNIDYDITLSTSFFEIKTLISFILLAAILVLGVLLFNKSRIISFGIFWFFVTIAVESSIIPISDLIFEHRTYLPSYGFMLILTTAIFTLLWPKNKNLALGILGLIIISNAVLTYQRNKVWQDEITLWTDAIKKSPNKARPYVIRGNAYEDLNKMDDAILDYNKAVELQPNYTLAFTNRGYAHKHKGNWQKAIQDYNKSISLNPLIALAYTNRGALHSGIKLLKTTLRQYRLTIDVRLHILIVL